MKNVKLSTFSCSRLPWNEETIIGYIAEILFNIMGCEVYYIANGATTLLFISMCLYNRAFLEMVQSMLHNLNNTDHKPNDRKQNDRKLLCKLIEFHVSVKRYPI